MNKEKIESIDVLEDIIVGRVDPNIYAFTTNTIPNYLKVGDTYRSVSTRLREWKKYFPELKKEFEDKAVISEDVYFRDFAVHEYLLQDLGKLRLLPNEIGEKIYYSREFFKDTEAIEVKNAIKDIKKNYEANSSKYEYYSANNRLPKTFHYVRQGEWTLRPNQQEAVNNFIKAVKNGRKNLLMYAVMRFGKSFTSLCCALEMEAKVVLVVSAKADVRDEWKKTVESAGNFEGYFFLDSRDLESNENVIDEKLKKNEKVVVFLTLQDLQGEEIKEKHQEVFNQSLDLLIVDETHFGARASSFGFVLRDNGGYEKEDEKNIIKLEDESIEINLAEEQIKSFKNAKIRLHLSGTPYRILMGSEFEKEDIISFVQFSDIVNDQKQWDDINLCKDDINEWDNPYYGFPQMIRFAFNPSKSAIEKMEMLKESGVSFAFSALLEPCSIKRDIVNKSHKKFKNEKEILDLLQVIDGSKNDENLLGFLDYNKIKEGKMCRHMVMVLPYCASCDAMENLLVKNKKTFKNFDEYEIINISGVEGALNYRTPNDVKNIIDKLEREDKKTLTLTVNRMLTGSTVEQWDTMLYFKDTASPQEYDQAIFRLQNQYVRTLASKDRIIKENLKPQTLLVDFDPNRLFRMQEQKSLIYNVNKEENGNSRLKERITEELRISPIITMNHNKIHQVEATNILEVVSEYNNQRSVSDEVEDLPIDLLILRDKKIRKVIEQQSEFNSNGSGGLKIKPVEGEGKDLDIDFLDGKREKDKEGEEKEKDYTDLKDKDTKSLEKKIRTYYQRILFFTFLTRDKVESLEDIINIIDSNYNERLAKNLYLERTILISVAKHMHPLKLSSLDYKIRNISRLASDESISTQEKIMTSLKKFNKISKSEVRTPLYICDKMVGMIPEDRLRKIVDNGEKLLDIGSKFGEYAVSLYDRLTKEIGYTIDEVKDLIYTIPTSSIAYEFIRKFYEILGLDINNIAKEFTVYDLLEIECEDEKYNYDRIAKLLKQSEKFSEISLKENIEIGDDLVKFGAVVGNPPYNESVVGTSDKHIYNHFMELSYSIADYTCLITPARFLFNAGKTPKKWNQKMLNDPHLKVMLYEQNSDKIFPNIGITGGLVITVRDLNESFGSIKTFTAFTELNSILTKVESHSKNQGLDSIIYLQNKFNLNSLYKDFPQYRSMIGSGGREKRLTTSIFSQLDIFKEKKTKEYNIKVLGLISNDRLYRYINHKYLEEHENLYCYKVILPKSNGSGAIGEVSSTLLIGEPLIGEPFTGFTQSFISIGAFESEYEANAALKYVKTKFARTMLGTLKITQDNNKATWKNVPIQNFTKESEIDWMKSVEDIDQQLYKKYNLSKSEIDFIESKVTSME